MRKKKQRLFLELRAALTRHNYTIADMAAHLGIAPQSASNKLTGSTQFTVKEALSLMKWLDVDTGAFSDCGKKAK